jgi:hypothetical protein
MDKKCRKCQLIKPIENYNYNETSGLYSYKCIECINNGVIEHKEYLKKYYIENQERLKAKQQLYNLNTVEQRKEYKRKNKEIIRAKNNIYYNNKMKIDKVFKLKENVRKLIQKSFKSAFYKKMSKTQEILGCTIEEFKAHLESKFEPWMNWSNYGLYNGTANYGWDIDHIIPLKTVKVEDDITNLNHYTNLQPLCSYYNRDIKRGNY